MQSNPRLQRWMAASYRQGDRPMTDGLLLWFGLIFAVTIVGVIVIVAAFFNKKLACNRIAWLLRGGKVHPPSRMGVRCGFSGLAALTRHKEVSCRKVLRPVSSSPAPLIGILGPEAGG